MLLHCFGALGRVSHL